jgi:Fe-S cluster biogenesis protein NfuA
MTTAERLYERVDEVLEKVRPSLQSHGGDVSLVEVTEDRVARVELTGACAGCPMSIMTLRMGIERILNEEIPELKGVEAVGLEDIELPEEIKREMGLI